MIDIRYTSDDTLFLFREHTAVKSVLTRAILKMLILKTLHRRTVQVVRYRTLTKPVPRAQPEHTLTQQMKMLKFVLRALLTRTVLREQQNV